MYRAKKQQTEVKHNKKQHATKADQKEGSGDACPKTNDQQLPKCMQLLNLTQTKKSDAGANRNAQMCNKSAEGNNNDKNKSTSTPKVDENKNAGPAPTLSKSARQRQKRKAALKNKYVSMDCEMVGVGCNGHCDMLARVSIVNKCGDVLLDKYVKPRERVVDYRTSVSGIRKSDIENGENFYDVQNKVMELLHGKILVGHALGKDLAVLNLKHPYPHIRDTSRYKPLARLVSNGLTPSLKRLSLVILGREIQIGEHNSVEDARAAMSIYNTISKDWEDYIQKRQHE